MPGGNINFPKLSPSPTHPPRVHQLPAIPTGQAGSRVRDRLPQITVTPRHRSSNNAQVINESHEEDYIPSLRVEPLSFEQAVAMGRGGVGRQLPSPMPNGFKPAQTSESSMVVDRHQSSHRSSSQRPVSNLSVQHGEDRHSESDEDDWC